MNITALIWIIAATTLAGICILVVLVMPQLGAMLHLSEARAVVVAGLAGAAVAAPIAIAVSKAITGNRLA